MSYKLELKEEALEELSEAYQFYEDEKKGLGEDFLDAINKMLIRIKETPHQYPLSYKNKHRAVLSRYPFMIIFEIEEEVITVYAVFHTSRDPKRWRKR